MEKLVVLKASEVELETVISLLVGRPVEEVERNLILQTLSSCGGNRTRAAKLLGITVRTLRNKIWRYRDAGIAVDSETRF